MALEISGNIELGNGINLSSCYARTLYKMDQNSNNIIIILLIWTSKASFDNGLRSLDYVFNIPSNYTYDRNTDGVDVLEFTQIKIKAELETLGYSVVITDI